MKHLINGTFPDWHTLAIAGYCEWKDVISNLAALPLCRNLPNGNDSGSPVRRLDPNTDFVGRKLAVSSHVSLDRRMVETNEP